MNNPLAQKYNYYLNESNRLNEELKTEEAYSELLENVLFELLGEEEFYELFEEIKKIKKFPKGLRKVKVMQHNVEKLKSKSSEMSKETKSSDPSTTQPSKSYKSKGYFKPGSRETDSWEKRAPRTSGEKESHAAGLSREQHYERIRDVVSGVAPDNSTPEQKARVKREFIRSNLADLYRKHTGKEPRNV
jgi:hypothetical protein